MKERIENIDYIEYKGVRSMFPHLFDETYSDNQLRLVFEKLFPNEFIKWERSIIGGNNGAHNINR
jgi:hypothetical protein